MTTLPVTDQGEVVLLRRGIEPGYGSWAQPGGFLEVDETVTEAAIRETLEETGLVVEPGEIVGLYSRLEAAVVVIAFEARIVGGEAHETPEALEVAGVRAGRHPLGRHRLQDDRLGAPRLGPSTPARPRSGPTARRAVGRAALSIRPAAGSTGHVRSLHHMAGRSFPSPRSLAMNEAFIGRHVRAWVLIVVTTVAVGTAGYMFLLGWSFDDAIYMTVISLTTVGFKEVRELDDLGRAWTMLLSIAGVAIIFGSVGIVAEAFIAEAAGGRREARRMREAVEGLGDHYIVCGYGRVGSTVARELAHSGQRFVIIDINPASLDTARTDGHLVVEGDATKDATLRSAGIERARGLITTIDSDANNVYVTLSARAINPRLFIVARANTDGADAKLAQAGADRIVSPYTRAGRQIAELAIRPRVADFLDAALSHGQLAFSMEEVEVAPGGPLDGVTVEVLRDRGAHVLAIVRGERDYEANPPSDRRLAAGEVLILSGSAEVLGGLRA